jgi:hypothetical protein
MPVTFAVVLIGFGATSLIGLLQLDGCLEIFSQLTEKVDIIRIRR